MQNRANRQTAILLAAAMLSLFGCVLFTGGCDAVPAMMTTPTPEAPGPGGETPVEPAPGTPDPTGEPPVVPPPVVIPEECAVPATVRVSVDSDGNEATGNATRPSISADGRFVAFDSNAADLLPGDTNGTPDVFVHDRETGVTTRVSVDSAGVQATGNSIAAAISADGRWVAFSSDAPDLIAADGNGVADIFLHDRDTGATTRVSVDSLGVEADGFSGFPSVSADGRLVAFTSGATNLDLVLADTNGITDVYVHDRQTGETQRVSFKLDGSRRDAAGEFQVGR